MATILFGGSFDPVHNGHLAMADCAAAFLPQATLLWIPAACSPFKTGSTHTPAHHRLAMCRLAAETRPNMRVSDLEITMEKPSYTVRTVERLQQQHKDDYFFLCGGDSFLSLQKWKEYEKLVKMVTFLVAVRETAPTEALMAQSSAIEGLGGRSVLLPMEPVDVSSSQVRTALFEGQPVGSLLPGGVADYIQQHGLYKE